MSDMNQDLVCVILAGGRGKRMGSVDRHKVCFPIGGVPAIVQAIDTYKEAGVRNFLVVVGQMAENVMSTVAAKHPEATFVYQSEPHGTGHAASIAADVLASRGYTGDVMIVMGDKMTRPHVVRQVMDRFHGSRAHVALATLPKDGTSTAGRVVEDGGKVLGVVEHADIENARRRKKRLPVGGRQLTAQEIENRSSTVNASLYMFRFPALHQALKQLKSANAQGELYLTDTVEIIGRKGKAVPVLVKDARDLMAYNTPAELLAIEEVFRQRSRAPRVAKLDRQELDASKLRPARQWLRLLQDEWGKLLPSLRKIYGNDSLLLEDRRRNLTELVAGFIKRHGAERPMVVVRAPGRVNLMGRHVDHRGGYVNVLAISREVLLAAAPRQDDLVTLNNLDPRAFPARKFHIFDLLRDTNWAGWLDFLASKEVRRVLEQARGDWSHYARAPLLRLQHECQDMPLRGMDCVIGGNIPMGAGLSSSSAMVVAFAEAAVAVNGLNVAMRDFIDLCGEGEWFVGSRGGSADHAAIRTGRSGYISRIGFFPFHLDGERRFPSDLRVVIAHSGSQAIKSKGARDIFNQRVACYELAEMLLRKHWPAAAGMEHLRDLTPHRLKVRSGEIYRALMLLPERATRKQLIKLLPEQKSRLDRLFDTHADLGSYDLRGVTLFGISECTRSDAFASVIESGDLAWVGRLMRTSHDGDRIVCHDESLRPIKHEVHVDDATLRRLAAAEADLTLQCGRYACSTPAIDQMVDLANATPGVVGAQLAGAGLGGCMMILVYTQALDDLLRRLRQEFYNRNGLEFSAYVCTPVAGAGLLTIR